MTEEDLRLSAEIAALTLVLRQIVARFPQDVADEMRRFVESRVRAADNKSYEARIVVSQILETMEHIFVAASPPRMM